MRGDFFYDYHFRKVSFVKCDFGGWIRYKGTYTRFSIAQTAAIKIIKWYKPEANKENRFPTIGVNKVA